MIIDLQSGLVKNIPYFPSPNFNERPANQVIDLLVIHNISLPPGEFGGDHVKAFFHNKLDIQSHPYFKEIANLKVSSHLFIRRTGDILQFVPLTKRAWHAGESTFKGRKNCNDYSIGIELEGTDKIPYTALQYEKLTQITVAIMQCFPHITPDKIVGHSDIAPSRKTDPGAAFDWQQYMSLVDKITMNYQLK
ncbi:MAG: 1,6-anhydro-N-acetylmuramyl-L-alanine amidase AmpD [Proteobacteria bacterium]|nr:1,6-anhydro-N-acetylmuramyl-L-alanine amidase AmpD [Pseudomonadota bacterium]